MGDNRDNFQEYKNPRKKIKVENNGENVTYDKACQTEEPQETIIVNQIPPRFDYDTLISAFSKYGDIKSTYICKRQRLGWEKNERVARITFGNEDDAVKAWRAAQEKLIAYNDRVLTVTLTSNDYSPIQNLPDTCLREIFDRVTALNDKLDVEMVCRRWRDNGRHCWSKIRKIRTLGGSNSAWRTIFSRVANTLEYLDFCGANDNAGTYAAAEPCVGLKELKWYLSDMNLELCSLSMCTILQKNGNLRLFHFHLCNQGILNMNFMNALPAGLYELDLRAGIDIARHRTIPSITLSTLVLSRLQNLRVLVLSGVTVTNHKAFDDLMNLKHLGLIHCHVPEASLLTILRNNQGLKYLDIGGEDLSSAALMCILQLPKLEIFVMDSTQFTDAHLRHMKSLKVLGCSRCYEVTDEGIQNYLKRASDIQYLFIKYCTITAKSIVSALEWTERTGKSLDLRVDDEVLDEYLDLTDMELPDPTSLKITRLRAGVHAEMHEDWFREFVEDILTAD